MTRCSCHAHGKARPPVRRLQPGARSQGSAPQYICLSSFEISSFILPRKFYLCSPLLSGGITAALLEAFADKRLDDGRARLVRHGHLPERDVLTGVGPVAVKVPRVRDRGAVEDKIRFTPSILPRYLRKAKSVEELLPWLYLKGVSTGDFSEELAALL